MNDRVFRRLRSLAIVLAVVVVGWMMYDAFFDRPPGESAYLAANTRFKDGDYAGALEQYRKALMAAPRYAPALEGAGRSLMQLDRLDEALAAFDEAIALDPSFAPGHANRGVLHDLSGRYEQAMADYVHALELDPALAKGMHWIDRLLYNVAEKPSTIADRLSYLEEQMALPSAERVLRVPEIDAEQRPYER